MKRKLFYIITLLISITILLFYLVNSVVKPSLAITIDGKYTDSLPSSGIYNLDEYTCSKGSTLTWDKIKRKLDFSFSSNNDNEICVLKFTKSEKFLLNTVPIGSYVAYTGSNGCQNYTEVTGNSTATSANACTGQNANQASDTSNYTYGYCDSSNFKFYTKGWRVAYKLDSDSDGTSESYIVSAGSPECVLATASDSTATITSLNTRAINYCNANYAYGGGCQNTYDVNGNYYNTWAMNGIDFYNITNQLFNEGRRLYSNGSTQTPATEASSGSTCRDVYSTKACGYNNDLIDNGGYYWFASGRSASDTLYWNPIHRRVHCNSTAVTFGARPVVHLKSSIYVTGGSGTMDNPYIISTYSFVINGGSNYTNNRSVLLSLEGDDVETMCISNTNTCTNYEPFSNSKEWTLTDGDGVKTVYVTYKDADGNIIEEINRTITYDTVAPTSNSISISNGTGRTRTLTLGSTGATKMCFSNTGNNVSDCTSWVDYETSYGWLLNGGTGEKTVYAFFKDVAGNISEAVSATTNISSSPVTINEDFTDTTYDPNIAINGSGSYPWVVNTTSGRFESNNKGVHSSSSVSTIMFCPNTDSTLTFDYGVSSESYWDKLTITLTGDDSSSVTIANAISGVNSGSANRTLSAGVVYTLTLTYTKNSSYSHYDDIGYIDNLAIQ